MLLCLHGVRMCSEVFLPVWILGEKKGRLSPSIGKKIFKIVKIGQKLSLNII
jgi:hypothetical protein